MSSFQQNHFYDIPVMLVLKFGLISCFVLMIPISLFLFKRKKVSLGSFTFFILFYFIFHILAMMSVNTMGTWWILGIFPFLYLPVIWLWREANLEHSNILRALAVLCFSIILLDNGYRYFKWFPYGHFDGAQYGSRFIGTSKPGFVSFEVIPDLYDYLNQLSGEAEIKPIEVNCQVIPLLQWNRWTTSLLLDYFAGIKKNRRFHFYVGPIGKDGKEDFLISSPLYYASFEKELLRSGGYERMKTISIKGIDIISVWRRKEVVFSLIPAGQKI